MSFYVFTCAKSFNNKEKKNNLKILRQDFFPFILLTKIFISQSTNFNPDLL